MATIHRIDANAQKLKSRKIVNFFGKVHPDAPSPVHVFHGVKNLGDPPCQVERAFCITAIFATRPIDVLIEGSNYTPHQGGSSLPEGDPGGATPSPALIKFQVGGNDGRMDGITFPNPTGILVKGEEVYLKVQAASQEPTQFLIVGFYNE